jgi:osmotically-inducible protein OsmY
MGAKMSTSRWLATTALAANLLLAACSVFGPCDSQCREDAKLRDEVQRQINQRTSLRFFSIDVQAHDQSVYLQGLVDTEVDRSAAQQIAMSVPGVKKVYNGLELNGNGAH